MLSNFCWPNDAKSIAKNLHDFNLYLLLLVAEVESFRADAATTYECYVFSHLLTPEYQKATGSCSHVMSEGQSLQVGKSFFHICCIHVLGGQKEHRGCFEEDELHF